MKILLQKKKDIFAGNVCFVYCHFVYHSVPVYKIVFSWHTQIINLLKS